MPCCWLSETFSTSPTSTTPNYKLHTFFFLFPQNEHIPLASVAAQCGSMLSCCLSPSCPS